MADLVEAECPNCGAEWRVPRPLSRVLAGAVLWHCPDCQYGAWTERVEFVELPRPLLPEPAEPGGPAEGLQGRLL